MNRRRRDRRGRKRERKENGEERWLSRPCVPKLACAGEREGPFVSFETAEEARRVGSPHLFPVKV